MSITRKYRTKRECAELFVGEGFDNIPSYWFESNPNANIEFYGNRDYEDGYEDGDEELGTFGFTHPPMWSTWFSPNDSLDIDWIENNLELVANLGFTIIRVYIDGIEDILLGIDGAGYSFFDQHWIPLYEARGFKWHEG